MLSLLINGAILYGTMTLLVMFIAALFNGFTPFTWENVKLGVKWPVGLAMVLIVILLAILDPSGKLRKRK